MYESFEWNRYTSGVFIDLSEVFHTANLSVLIKKLQMYDIQGSILPRSIANYQTENSLFC